jgi:hypothetical protein
MITVKNYSDKIKNVDWTKIPKEIKALKDDIDFSIEFYDDDPGIKETVDLFLKAINKVPERSGPKKATGKKKPVKTEKEEFIVTNGKLFLSNRSGKFILSDNIEFAYQYSESQAKAQIKLAESLSKDKTNFYITKIAIHNHNSKQGNSKPKVNTSTTKKPSKKVATKIDAKIVDGYSKEFMLVRRFYNLVKKEKASFRQIQLVYMAFQKAIVGRDVRKTSDDADLFTKVNEKMVSLFDKVSQNKDSVERDGVDITLSDNALMTQMEKLVKGSKTNYAITLMRSFIGMQNTKPDVTKAKGLLKRMENAIANDKVDKDNRLFPAIKEAITELKEYIKEPTKEIEPEAFGLSKPGKKSLCDNRVKCEGLNADGTLKKGYKFIKGGHVVKAGVKKKASKKKVEAKPKQLGTIIIKNDIIPTPTVVKVEGLASVGKLDSIPVKHIEPQYTEILEDQPIVQTGDLNGLKKLGFDMASDGPPQNIESFILPGEIGKFLQEIQPHKSLILIKGTKHTSKSQLAMQIANAFGTKGDPVGFIDGEQGGLISKDTQNSVKWNTTREGIANIAIIGELKDPMTELNKICEHCKVVIADSVQELGLTADELNSLRSNYEDVVWIFISQVKENGVMYGGNKMAHNPTCIIECHPSADPKKRYATLEKNRGNDLSLAYSIYEKRLIDVVEFTSSNIPKTMTV